MRLFFLAPFRRAVLKQRVQVALRQDKRMIVILHKNSFMFGDCNPDFRANNPIFRPLLHVIA